MGAPPPIIKPILAWHHCLFNSVSQTRQFYSFYYHHPSWSWWLSRIPTFENMKSQIKHEKLETRMMRKGLRKKLLPIKRELLLNRTYRIIKQDAFQQFLTKCSCYRSDIFAYLSLVYTTRIIDEGQNADDIWLQYSVIRTSYINALRKLLKMEPMTEHEQQIMEFIDIEGNWKLWTCWKTLQLSTTSFVVFVNVRITSRLGTSFMLLYYACSIMRGLNHSDLITKFSLFSDYFTIIRRLRCKFYLFVVKTIFKFSCKNPFYRQFYGFQQSKNPKCKLFISVEHQFS